jgi:hypothetical protein
MHWYKTSWMLLFRCKFSKDELAAFKNYLPEGEYCLVGGPGENEYYGVMEEGLHDKLMDILSGETLGVLEYLDEGEMRECMQRSEAAEKLGNNKLLEEYQ